MPSLASTWQSWSPRLLSVLRIVAAFMFITFGTMKLIGYPMEMPPGAASALMTFAGILEAVGGLLLLIGLWTRPIAFIVAGEMAFAYFMGHAAVGFWPIINGGVGAVLYCFLWLYVSAVGAGPWSVDEMLCKRRAMTPHMEM